ncbi:MAG: BT1926 family outer membrane beta-barrel protein [Bacteroidia bacterium]|nr:BT1926 family outer membrane beta-barrel protein [Bacteroidia bacterium]
MNRLFYILTLLTVFCVSATAQQQEAGGNMQVSVILGNNPMFSQNGQDQFLLPDYNSNETGVTSDPGVYLNMGNVGSNSLMNMVGVQFSYYLSSALDVNAMFSMNISSTPKKDYIEALQGQYGEAISPASRCIEGRLQTNWYANVGANYHFSGANKHVSPYVGVRAGGEMGRLQTVMPYTGDDEDVLYIRTSKAGQMWSLQGAIVGGVECVLNSGIVLGCEVFPVSYQYSVINIDPTGSYSYSCGHHGIKIFSTPTIKFGFRF